MPGPTLSKNTADFELLFGGRYLLESVTPGTQPNGYLLEDGSGVLLLDCVTPSLGDPVVFTNPSWSGRVVSVAQDLIVDGAKRNYKRVSITATNQTADPGGTAPGDFSDVAGADFYLLEDGTGDYLLEGGTDIFGVAIFGEASYGEGAGRYVLEGAAFVYRELSVRQSQNQDGTTTTYGSLVTFEGGFKAGQTFLLTNHDLGFTAQSFAITNVTVDFIGANSPTPRYRIEFGDAYQTLRLAGGGILTQQASVASTQLGVLTPGGVLGYAQVTDLSGLGTFTATTDLTGLSVTVTVASGRRIVISGKVDLQSSVAADRATLFIFEGATQLQRIDVHIGVINVVYGATVSVILTPTAGVHTYKLAAARASGTGNITAEASTAEPAFILVEDIGT